MAVRDHFVTTLHAINHGVTKFARLSTAIEARSPPVCGASLPPAM